MIETLAGLMPRSQVTRVRKVERKPESKNDNKDKEALPEKEEVRQTEQETTNSSQGTLGTFLDERGNLFDQLL